MTQNMNDRTESEDVSARFLHQLKNKSVSGAIQILLNALFSWSRTCHHLRLDSVEVSQFTVIPSVIHKEVRQEVYEKTRKVAYTSRAERWPHWEPHPPSTDNDSRVIQDIVDYAAILSLEDAVAFFVRLISHWIKKCSVEAVLADLKRTGRGKHINRPLTESEVIAELQHSLDLSIFDYESMDA